MSGDGDELDLLAGEYVLGTLDSAASLAVERRAAADPDLAHAIARWQARLAPLGELVEAAPEPEGLWTELAPKLRPVLPAGPRVPLAGAETRGACPLARSAAAGPPQPGCLAAGGGGGAAGGGRRNGLDALATSSSAGPCRTASGRHPDRAGRAGAPIGPSRRGLGRAGDLAPARSGGRRTRPQPRLLAAAGGSGSACPASAIPASGGRLPGPRLPEGSQVMVTLEPADGPGATPGRTLFAGVVTDLR